MANRPLCMQCTKYVKKNAQAITCDLCNKWTHRACGTGFTIAAYKKAVKAGGISFVCKACRPNESSDSSDRPILSDDDKPPPPKKCKGKKTHKPVETTRERVTRLQKEKHDNLQDMISNLTSDSAKELLLLAAEKMPSLVFDVAESATNCLSSLPDPDPDPQPSTPNWCKCQHCREMPTDEEKLCCNMAPKFCMSLRPELEQFCLEPGVLIIANNIRNDIFVRDADDNLNKQYRHAAYRQFIYWRYGRLGEGNRRVIPSCVVWRIRERYPSPFGQYVGFKAGRLV